MTIKNVSDALDILTSMTYDQRDKLSYFAMGMLYAFTLVEPNYDDVDITLTKTEEETT